MKLCERTNNERNPTIYNTNKNNKTNKPNVLRDCEKQYAMQVGTLGVGKTEGGMGGKRKSFLFLFFLLKLFTGIERKSYFEGTQFQYKATTEQRQLKNTNELQKNFEQNKKL